MSQDRKNHAKGDREDLAVGTLIDQVGTLFPGDASAAIRVLSRAVQTVAEGASPYARDRLGEFEHGCDHLFDRISVFTLGSERSVIICALARVIRKVLPDQGVGRDPDPALTPATADPVDQGDER